MFRRLKKKQEVYPLHAYSEGKLIAITDVKDEVFSKKMLGEGIAIEPSSNIVYAPMDAKITMLFPSLHAIGLESMDGMEILIHIGIDTVQEDGKGFEAHVKSGDHVVQGTPLISFQREEMLAKGYDITTILVFTKPDSYSTLMMEAEKEVITDDIVISYQK